VANNDDLILRGKALRDLRGIKDVLLAQGDPILASILNRAISCIENQPTQGKHPIDGLLLLAAKYKAALQDLATIADCDYCKHNGDRTQEQRTVCMVDCEKCATRCPCHECENGSMWEWRHSDV
jgi:hypothetical protein